MIRVVEFDGTCDITFTLSDVLVICVGEPDAWGIIPIIKAIEFDVAYIILI